MARIGWMDGWIQQSPNSSATIQNLLLVPFISIILKLGAEF